MNIFKLQIHKQIFLRFWYSRKSIYNVINSEISMKFVKGIPSACFYETQNKIKFYFSTPFTFFFIYNLNFKMWLARKRKTLTTAQVIGFILIIFFVFDRNSIFPVIHFQYEFFLLFLFIILKFRTFHPLTSNISPVT